MTFEYRRTICFAETDAAGVVYFSRIFNFCHEAYEASLQQTGINVRTFFSRGETAVPITHTEADFHRPLLCGDGITIQLVPIQTALDSFDIRYTVLQETGKTAAIALTRHVCIETATRQRQPLTEELTQWLQQYGSA
ncbi:acyl-CoA thioesterase [Oscillatoria sp. CS-180]|uniref:acyl-CoA thioesterase n=1 Tax=Oscillatoria sp. CS-180 TaxID=3021720 RepID=UPI00232FBA36|nr:acyl-CoA thioesterase [Oscillatoria sp. CS-180]MDB9527355.1 acyl-CoA thioesterase [Oscillatoria sp. CS-180]